MNDGLHGVMIVINYLILFVIMAMSCEDFSMMENDGDNVTSMAMSIYVKSYVHIHTT